MDDKNVDKSLDLILSGFQSQTRQIEMSVESGDTESFRGLKVLLEIYGFLLHWYLINLESSSLRKPAKTGTGRKVSPEFSKACERISQALDGIYNCLKLNLSGLFVTSSEKDLFTGLFLRPLYLFMENEQIIKTGAIKLQMFNIISMAVKLYQQSSGVQTSLMQLLIYFDHLSEPLAELLQILYEQYDNVQITEEMLKELSQKNFNSNDLKGPKYVSLFIIKLSELIPQILIKHLLILVKLLESESFTLRSAIIESTGNIIFDLVKRQQVQQADEEVSTDQEQQNIDRIHSLLDLIQERVLDINPFCRCKALQVLTGICELEVKFTSRRLKITKIAVQSLNDKSNLVRRNGLKLLSRLVSTHPFGYLHGTQLEFKQWQARLDQANKELGSILPQDKDAERLGDQSMVNSQYLDNPSDDEGESNEKQAKNEEHKKNEEEEEVKSTQDKQQTAAHDEEAISRLRLTRKYYLEALEFIEFVHEGLTAAEKLLFSKNKNEIIESMDLFVLADAYGIEVARVGIRKMIHLIWAKANNDEGHAIQSHLITCYQSLFFDSPVGISESDSNLLVARNLISLTYGATLAELASLEHLIVLAIEKERLISPGVIKTLWKIYGYQQREISKSQRRGAIIILGMISKAEHSVAMSGIELLLKIGLGEQGRKDLGLAKYTCIALQQCVSDDDWKKFASNGKPSRFPVNHEVITKLCELLLVPFQMDWFGVAEQAIKAINDLCENPTVVFSEVIRHKSKLIFTSNESNSAREESLSQLLFIVGDVALKIMVHLERCEALFKQSKIAVEKANANKRDKDKEGDDLEMVGGGTSEDDFTEAISYIREREMLYGNESLLTLFGFIASEICKEGLAIPDQQDNHLIISATLCVAKFMCVSSTYCEENLAILMTYLERSDNSIIKNNLVLALGDIAVCFNHILDDNTDFLYRRLHDEYLIVQRTCLMTLTFLILAGQVKVKGQLGEMAKCLEDPDKRISDLSRMFFSELATKDNAIYNGFIDMFSILNADPNLSQDKLHKILRFLTSFIDKEKQIKQLADKLHNRLLHCQDEKTWQDLTYVLGALPHKSEEIQKTISDGFKFVPIAVE